MPQFTVAAVKTVPRPLVKTPMVAMPPWPYALQCRRSAVARMTNDDGVPSLPVARGTPPISSNSAASVS